MPLIPNETLMEARNMDALTWLQMNEPENLVRISENCWCTREHDSLKISNGKWFWWSRGFGGVSALDYLVKVKEYTFARAVEAIVGRGAVTRAAAPARAEPEKPRTLLIPELEKNPDRVRKYLEGRGIQKGVINFCITHSLIFETKDYHNAMFVGYDGNGIARYAMLRGTASGYKGEVTGSDKHYSFSIPGTSGQGHLHLFESAIDLLSHASMELMDGRDWRRDDLLSLAGVFRQKRGMVVPVALKQYLETHDGIRTIHLHLDNDEVGRGAAAGIMEGLGEKYEVLDEPAPEGFKDMNDELAARVSRNMKRKEDRER